MDCRLACEYPFPTGVEDGVAALLHLESYAERYCVDLRRKARSGFSVGGNMALTISLRLQADFQLNSKERAPKSSDPTNYSYHAIPCIV